MICNHLHYSNFRSKNFVKKKCLPACGQSRGVSAASAENSVHEVHCRNFNEVLPVKRVHGYCRNYKSFHSCS